MNSITIARTIVASLLTLSAIALLCTVALNPSDASPVNAVTALVAAAVAARLYTFKTSMALVSHED